MHAGPEVPRPTPLEASPARRLSFVAQKVSEHLREGAETRSLTARLTGQALEPQHIGSTRAKWIPL
jgi:hypothetical protein